MLTAESLTDPALRREEARQQQVPTQGSHHAGHTHAPALPATRRNAPRPTGRRHAQKATDPWARAAAPAITAPDCHTGRTAATAAAPHTTSPMLNWWSLAASHAVPPSAVDVMDDACSAVLAPKYRRAPAMDTASRMATPRYTTATTRAKVSHGVRPPVARPNAKHRTQPECAVVVRAPSQQWQKQVSVPTSNKHEH